MLFVRHGLLGEPTRLELLWARRMSWHGSPPGPTGLWPHDGAHASRYGSYLSALTLFGQITGVNPFSLGAGETAARELGIGSADALALQRVAALQLGFDVPLPATLSLAALALALMAGLHRRRWA